MEAFQDQTEKGNEVTGDEMRTDFRAVLSSVAWISFNEVKPCFKAEIVNLSFGGIKIRFAEGADLPGMVPGTSCQVRACIKEKEEVFPGKLVWTSGGIDGPIQAGIQFEGLSVDDKADLVALFMWDKYTKNSPDLAREE